MTLFLNFFLKIQKEFVFLFSLLECFSIGLFNYIDVSCKSKPTAPVRHQKPTAGPTQSNQPTYPSKGRERPEDV